MWNHFSGHSMRQDPCHQALSVLSVWMALSLNCPEETPSPRRDSEKTGRIYTSKTIIHMVSPCFLGVDPWVWSLFWGILGYCVCAWPTGLQRLSGMWDIMACFSTSDTGPLGPRAPGPLGPWAPEKMQEWRQLFWFLCSFVAICIFVLPLPSLAREPARPPATAPRTHGHRVRYRKK